MARSKVKPGDLDREVIEMRKDLAGKIAARAQALGENPTAVPGLALYRRDKPTPCFHATYEPSLSVFVQGKKRVSLGGTEYLCDGSSFLLSSIDVPAVGQITEASERLPLLSMFLRLDMTTVREVIGHEDLPELDAAIQSRGLAVGETTMGLLSAYSPSSTFSKLPKIFLFSAT